MKRLAQQEGQRSAWQRGGWTATSCLLHVTLLGSLVLFRPAAENGRPLLRVRLVEEPTSFGSVAAPVPPPPVKPVAVPRRPAPRLAPTREAPSRMVASGETVGERILSVPAEPQVAMPFAPAPAPEPSPARGVGEDGGVRRTFDGEGKPSGGESSHVGLGEADAVPAQEATEKPAGLFIVSGGGNGTGPAGVGAAAGHGAGGNGTGIDRGGSGGGNGAAAGHGAGGAAGLGARAGSGAGSGAGTGVGHLLSAIRRQIEQAKIYPDGMRREGIQGIVELRFRIASDGSVEAIEVARSSGHRVLDEVSARTIRRAGPYPFVAGWIRIPLEYRLDR